MQFFVLLLSALIVLVAAAPQITSTNVIIENKLVSDSNCSNVTSTINKVTTNIRVCTVTGSYRYRHNDVCNVSTYDKKTESSLVPTVTFGPLNGIAQCTKTPCDVTEKITVDCKDAFTATQLTTLESYN
uniref:Secreted protein n=1 Tax=Caenorhabditis tropicalis TaxID=1561998 RepID=A0A1I7TT10_9PELO